MTGLNTKYSICIQGLRTKTQHIGLDAIKKIPLFRFIRFLLIATGLFVLSRPEPYAFGAKPSVILISIDTLRADHLTCYGYNKAISPNIDKIASEGILFENAFTSYPWTLPAHASMLTGLYGSSHKVEYYDGGYVRKIGINTRTIAEILSDAGWETVGIVNPNHVSSAWGFNKGFDFWKESFEYDEKEQQKAEMQGPRDVVITDEVIKWLEAYSREKPFFMFIHYWSPHSPYQAPGQYLDVILFPNPPELKFGSSDQWGNFQINILSQENGLQRLISLYDAEIKYVDKNIGTLIETLKRMGFYNNTIIILTSDHGEEFFEHDGSDHGFTSYNESIKVPLIIKLEKEREIKNREIQSNVNIAGIVPTILDLLGIKTELRFDFPSLKRFWEGDKTPFNIYIENKRPWDFNHNNESMTFITKAIIKEQMKYIYFWTEGKEELYDLDKDLGEKDNLFDSLIFPLFNRSLISTLRDIIERQIADKENGWIFKWVPEQKSKRLFGTIETNGIFTISVVTYNGYNNRSRISEDRKAIFFELDENLAFSTIYYETEPINAPIRIKLDGYESILTGNQIKRFINGMEINPQDAIIDSIFTIHDNNFPIQLYYIGSLREKMETNGKDIDKNILTKEELERLKSLGYIQ